MRQRERRSRWGFRSKSTAAATAFLLAISASALADSDAIAKREYQTPDLRSRFKLETAFVEQLPADLDFSEFEGALQESAFGTFVFYDRLTPDNKHKVYSGYQQDRNISAIGVNTLELLRLQ